MKKNNKFCPKCGNIEPDNHVYCSNCGTRLEDADDDYENIQRNDRRKRGKSGNIFVKMIVSFAVIYFVISVFVNTFLSKIGSDVTDKSFSDEEKLSVCEEYNIKDLAVKSFKNEDYYYKFISPDSVSNTYLNNIEQKSYYSDADKYYCKGEIEVIAKKDGFKPLENVEQNAYYAKIYHKEGSPETEYLDKYTSYKCEVEYTVQNPKGSASVKTSACGKGGLYDSVPPAEFECEGICDPYIISEAKPQEATEEVKETPLNYDAEDEVDFTSYIEEVQRSIYANWNPPKMSVDNRVKVVFTVSKNGGLQNIQITESSGIEDMDRAAINAVKLASPFKPLPAKYNKDEVDVNFDFDYKAERNYY